MFNQKNIRMATSKEKDFYINKLYPLQDNILTQIQTDRFYLSGGSCLSRFYYRHRFSEDLDFFFDGYRFPKEEFNIIYREIIQRLSKNFKINAALDGEFFKRIFIKSEGISLKIEFIYENYEHVGDLIREKDFFIDSKENVGTNKVTAIQDRKTVKDFVDLYYLMQELTIDRLYQFACRKIVPLDYEGAILAFTEPKIEGTVMLTKNISIKDLNNFSKNIITTLINHAKKIH